MIDFISFCLENNIPYMTEGKNIGADWIHISCPFCSDTSYHLGFSTVYNTFKCWRCGKHQPKKVFLRLSNMPFKEIYKRYYRFNDSSIVKPIKRNERRYRSEDIKLPKEFKDIDIRHIKFLKKRNFNWREIKDKYKIKGTGILGNFKNRLIMPVYHNGNLVTFTGRDITGKNETRYKNCPRDMENRSIKNCLYNLDNIKGDKVIIVEGITDVWRLGNCAVATFGTEYTTEQILLMKKFKKIFIMYDEDAINKAESLACELGLFADVEVLEISGDPGDLTKEEVFSIKSELFI